jgi:putative phosphoribosyl transferase
VRKLGDIADEIVCAETPEPSHAVGIWYEDFSQTTDEEVHTLLDQSRWSLHAAI